MGEKTVEDLLKEVEDQVAEYQAEAVKNVINAFNEGYYLGKLHARQVLGDDDENKN